MRNKPLQIIEISSSGRRNGSVSRQLCTDLIAALVRRHGAVDVTRRDLSDGMPFVDEAWIEANFTPEESRKESQHKSLLYSDLLVSELKIADVLVIGVPVYNFSISAALKAWIDMIARAGLTFRYTENGPKGLLEGKKAYLVVATGGVEVGGPIDFATPYLRHILSFVGITDVEVIAADKLNSDTAGSMDRASASIAELIHAAPDAA